VPQGQRGIQGDPALAEIKPPALQRVSEMVRPQNPGIEIDSMRAEDWNSVRIIYMEGIKSGNATFETSIPEWDQFDKEHLAACRLVARCGSEVLGWAALSAVSHRHVYAGVAEASLYVAERVRGRGIGRALLRALITSSEKEGLWTLQAAIFPENTASLELVRSLGFRVVGTRERPACMDGRWRDVVLLERRSSVAGV
jgi:L-amino acid N-acyltransferase YncA